MAYCSLRQARRYSVKSRAAVIAACSSAGAVGSRSAARQGEAFLRPGLEALVEERQVEQPFAGIVDDVECQLAHRPRARLVFDDEPQFADLPRRLRPDAIGEQCVEMALIVEARHCIVGLRRKMRIDDAPLVLRLEHRKAAAADEAVHQCGDEHGLARPRQPGDAEPDRRIEQAAAVFDQSAGGKPRFLDEFA
jgi:hypothetical protein